MEKLVFQKKLAKLLQVKSIKRIVFIFGIFFMILTFFSSINPELVLRFGYVGVFIFNLFGPGSLIAPILSRHMNIVGLAFFTALGMAFNDSVAWLIGSSGESILPKNKKIERIEGSVNKYGVYALLFWSFIPFPYDLIGLVAGYLGMTYPRYIIPTFLGKFIRVLLIGAGVVSFWGKI